VAEQININARKKARIIAMQALYQWSMSDDELYGIELQYVEHNDVSKIDLEYFRELLYQVPKNLTEVDAAYSSYIDRPITEINPIELSVLRVASYELLNRLEIPYKVIINEALSLAKRFGSTSGHKYVNGILDKVAKNIRATEINNASNNG
jgi:N utilization substance protein B